MELLRKKIDQLKKKHERGEVEFLEENLKQLFIDLKNFTTPDLLNESIFTLRDGTMFLEEKIKEFERFISYLNNKEIVISYIKKCKEDKQLSNLLTQNIHSPVLFPRMSVSFLTESFNRLVKNKPTREKRGALEIPRGYSPKSADLLQEQGEPFKIGMKDFYFRIKNVLPATIPEIMQTANNLDDYYRDFTYLLHLIQKNYLYYDKKSENIYVRDAM